MPSFAPLPRGKVALALRAAHTPTAHHVPCPCCPFQPRRPRDCLRPRYVTSSRAGVLCGLTPSSSSHDKSRGVVSHKQSVALSLVECISSPCYSVMLIRFLITANHHHHHQTAASSSTRSRVVSGLAVGGAIAAVAAATATTAVSEDSLFARLNVRVVAVMLFLNYSNPTCADLHME